MYGGGLFLASYHSIAIEDLVLNTDNARFIDPDIIFETEEDILEYMAHHDNFHIAKLAEDIAIHGLHLTDIPVVLPHPTIPGKYTVKDGNRRLTCIKMMTQYKNDLQRIGIRKSIRNKINSLVYPHSSIQCVVGDSEEEVDQLLENIHTAPEGINRLRWDAQARDKHKLKKSNTMTHRYAVISMLRYSTLTPPEIKDALKTSRWVSKLGRLLRNKDVRRFFGIEFEHGTSDVILYLKEEEVIKGLSQVVYHLAIDEKNYPASKYIQTLENQNNYLREFPLDKKPDVNKVVPRKTKFNVSTNTFEYGEEIVAAATIRNDAKVDERETQNSNQFDGQQKPSNNSVVTENNLADNAPNAMNNQSNIASLPTSWPRKITTLIPRENNILITNTRTAALYKDLQSINIIYINTISIAFRSLVEFSINALFERVKHKLYNNRQETLENKLEKAILILESKYGKTELMHKFPAIYAAIHSHKNQNCIRIDSIPVLNILVHNYNYHPTPKEMIQIYNNYKPFLEVVWEYINSVEK